MNLVDVGVKIRCDMPNCKSVAKYKLTKPGFIKNAGLFLFDKYPHFIFDFAFSPLRSTFIFKFWFKAKKKTSNSPFF